MRIERRPAGAPARITHVDCRPWPPRSTTTRRRVGALLSQRGKPHLVRRIARLYCDARFRSRHYWSGTARAIRRTRCSFDGDRVRVPQVGQARQSTPALRPGGQGRRSLLIRSQHLGKSPSRGGAFPRASMLLSKSSSPRRVDTLHGLERGSPGSGGLAHGGSNGVRLPPPGRASPAWIAGAQRPPDAIRSLFARDAWANLARDGAFARASMLPMKDLLPGLC